MPLNRHSDVIDCVLLPRIADLHWDEAHAQAVREERVRIMTDMVDPLGKAVMAGAELIDKYPDVLPKLEPLIEGLLEIRNPDPSKIMDIGGTTWNMMMALTDMQLTGTKLFKLCKRVNRLHQLWSRVR
jgi:hypothetical protein